MSFTSRDLPVLDHEVPDPRRRSFLHSCLERIDPCLIRRVVSGAIWSTVGAGIASGLTMVSNVACARFLGATHYGELAIVLATTNLFTSLFTSGVGMTAVKYVAEYRNSNRERAGAFVGLSTVTSILVGAATMLLVVAMSPWLSQRVLGSPELAGSLSIGALAMFFASVNGSQIGALTGFEAFRLIAWGNLFRGCGIALFVTAGAAIGSVRGALIGYAAAGAAVVLFYQITVRRQCAANGIGISYRFRRDDFRVLWRFTAPALLATFSFTPAVWWSNVLLANKSGYSETGVFNAVLHWQLFVLFFSSAISNIGLPVLSNLWAERDPSKYKRCLYLNFLLTSAPAIAIAVPVAFCARIILRLYGPTFQHGATALVLISFAAVLSALNLAVGPAIWSLDATTPAVLLALLRGATLVGASYALADKGATGIAWAYVVMGLVQTAVTVPYLSWILRRKFPAITNSAAASAA